MAFAPLDAWVRLLRAPPAWIPPRYWPRLAFALFTSALATITTLPERVLFGLWLRLKRSASDHVAPPVFILGYYRSGTTHLHYLLDCDPNLYSPKWVHTSAPQGFILSWTLLRLVMIPFMPATRPVDALAFGPEVPSEDDFALNNWAVASTLAGRAVLPRARPFYDRFNDLCDLTPAERERWRRCQLAFTRKLALVSGGRRLLLKTPSHTARVEALLALFPGAKFIHITRDPHAVLRSNVSMAQVVYRRYGLQDPPPPEETEQQLVREYVATEQRYLETRAKIPHGQLAEIRFQDLLADPIGELQRVYRELDLAWNDVFEQRLLAYLDATRNYAANDHRAWTAEQARRLTAALAPLIEQFGHDRPAIAKVELPPLPANQRMRPRRAAIAGVATAIACAAVWFLVATLTANRQDWLVWPTGVAIGEAVRRTARRGSRPLGLWSALLTLLALAGVTFLYNWAGDGAVWRTTISELTIRSHPFWTFMGLQSSARSATAKFTAATPRKDGAALEKIREFQHEAGVRRYGASA